MTGTVNSKTSTNTKTPTARGVSALLRKAGFERSASSASRVRGWHNYSAGFRTENRRTGTVRVEHVSGAFHPSDADCARSREIEDQYAEALHRAGYTVYRDAWGKLTITGNEEQTP